MEFCWTLGSECSRSIGTLYGKQVLLGARKKSNAQRDVMVAFHGYNGAGNNRGR